MKIYHPHHIPITAMEIKVKNLVKIKRKSKKDKDKDIVLKAQGCLIQVLKVQAQKFQVLKEHVLILLST